MPREIGPAAYFWGVPRRVERARRETFAEFADRFRGPIHLLCYRLTGSFDDAIRLTYDIFLTAWRLRHSAPADVRGWLTAMAVRASVEYARRRRRPVRDDQRLPPAPCVPRTDVTWLQPYPDRLLPDDVDPTTIGLPFVAATQALAPRDRATLVLTDVEGWSSARTAGALRMPNADARPRLTRARAIVGTIGSSPASRHADDPIDDLLDGYAAADLDLIDGLLHDDVRATMPPLPFSFEGRSSVVEVLAHVFHAADPGERGLRRCLPTRANRQPAFVVYVQPDPGAAFRGHELVVARAEAGRIVELTLFEPHLLPAFGFPTSL